MAITLASSESSRAKVSSSETCVQCTQAARAFPAGRTKTPKGRTELTTPRTMDVTSGGRVAAAGRGGVVVRGRGARRRRRGDLFGRSPVEVRQRCPSGDGGRIDRRDGGRRRVGHRVGRPARGVGGRPAHRGGRGRGRGRGCGCGCARPPAVAGPRPRPMPPRRARTRPRATKRPHVPSTPSVPRPRPTAGAPLRARAPAAKRGERVVIAAVPQHRCGPAPKPMPRSSWFEDERREVSDRGASVPGFVALRSRGASLPCADTCRPSNASIRGRCRMALMAPPATARRRARPPRARTRPPRSTTSATPR